MSNKILLLIPGDSSYLRPIRETFNDLGWEIGFVDYRRGNLMIRISRILNIIFNWDISSKLIDKLIVDTAKYLKPNIVLTVKGESLSKELIEELKRTGSIVINWFPDPMSQWENIVRIAPYYDIFFHFDPLIIRRLRKLGYKNIRYLPFAAQLEADPEAEISTEYTISFVGTYSEFREKYLSSLRGFDLNIWGDKRWFKSSLKMYVRGGRISQDEMKDVIKKSQINLNLHFNAQKEGTNLRTFEVLGCGKFLLTEYVKDLDELFVVGKELDIFKNPDEMRKKVEYYSVNPKKINAISKAGYKRAARDNNYIVRVEQMLGIVSDRKFFK